MGEGGGNFPLSSLYARIMTLLNFPNGFCWMDFWNILTLAYFKGTIFWFYSYFLPKVMVKFCLFVFCFSFKFNVCTSIYIKYFDLLSSSICPLVKHIGANIFFFYFIKAASYVLQIILFSIWYRKLLAKYLIFSQI